MTFKVPKKEEYLVKRERMGGYLGNIQNAIMNNDPFKYEPPHFS